MSRQRPERKIMRYLVDGEEKLPGLQCLDFEV